MKTILSLIVVALLSTSAFAYDFAKEIPQAVKQQMIDDMAFIGQIKGSTTSILHKQIYGAVDGITYKNFFESRVSHVGRSNCGNPNAVACVQPGAPSSIIWITDNYIKFSHPQIARLMIVFHESRHTEDDHGNWGHARCPIPFRDEKGQDMKSIWTGAKLAGEPACDVTPLGSYGSTTIMLKNISKFCTSCTDKVKMDAGLYSNDQFGRIIDAQAKADMKKDIMNAMSTDARKKQRARIQR